jgi:hypothetical protein
MRPTCLEDVVNVARFLRVEPIASDERDDERDDKA